MIDSDTSLHQLISIINVNDSISFIFICSGYIVVFSQLLPTLRSILRPSAI